ncbi:MAG: hypothetical protein C4321_01440, partial [Chloroflexota bacterium]
DARAAIDAAYAARDAWRESDPSRRGELLLKAAHEITKNEKELGALLTKEQGKPFSESVREVRRFALDEMRAGRIAEAEKILLGMEAIYEELITFDYSDSLTNGLRRTTDALRAVVERTRSDLTITASQNALVAALAKR